MDTLQTYIAFFISFKIVRNTSSKVPFFPLGHTPLQWQNFPGLGHLGPFDAQSPEVSPKKQGVSTFVLSEKTSLFDETNNNHQKKTCKDFDWLSWHLQRIGQAAHLNFRNPWKLYCLVGLLGLVLVLFCLVLKLRDCNAKYARKQESAKNTLIHWSVLGRNVHSLSQTCECMSTSILQHVPLWFQSLEPSAGDKEVQPWPVCWLMEPFLE